MLPSVMPLTLALLPLAAQVTTGQEVVCSGDCVGKWDKCAGKDFPTARACCDDTFVCTRKNAAFSQCRPEGKSVPSSWDGSILTCAGGEECEDPEAVTIQWIQVDAGSGTNFQLGLNLGSVQENDGCAEACAADDDCFAFSEYEFARGGERCELWARDLISVAPLIDSVDNEPNLEPSLFTNISFVKCFQPPALCDPEEEVRQVPNDSGPFFKYAESGGGGFDRNRAESFYTTGSDDDAFAACITVCRLSQSPPAFEDPLDCIGFALDVVDIQGEPTTLCTLLYNEGVTREFVPQADTRVYTLDDCPTSTELAQM
eukprot:jgi/Ulvmu1/5470/UM023_0006.1